MLCRISIDERFGSPVFGELEDIDLTVGLINIIDFRFPKVPLKCCIFLHGKGVIIILVHGSI